MKIANSRKDENYLTIYGWMTNRLKLSGNELLVYGLIYSFARDEEAEFHGSAGYIASALNMSRRTVVSTLKSLTNKGLIQKRAAGRYCNYSVSPVQNLHTSNIEPAQNLHTSCAEIAHISVQNLLEPAQNLHQTSANSSHHIKSISKVDIKNDSSSDNVEKEQQTTTEFININIQKFLEASKNAGFTLDRKAAEKILDNEAFRHWVNNRFNFLKNYLKYTAQRIKTDPRYADKPDQELKRLFISALFWEDFQEDYEEWRKKTEIEIDLRAAAETERQRIDTTRQNKPKTCHHCEASLDQEGKRGNCSSCGWNYFFNEDTGEWEFNEPRSLSEEYRKIIQGRGKHKTDTPPDDDASKYFTEADDAPAAIPDEDIDF